MPIAVNELSGINLGNVEIDLRGAQDATCE
jgi:hypothetical protein